VCSTLETFRRVTTRWPLTWPGNPLGGPPSRSARGLRGRANSAFGATSSSRGDSLIYENHFPLPSTVGATRPAVDAHPSGWSPLDRHLLIFVLRQRRPRPAPSPPPGARMMSSNRQYSSQSRVGLVWTVERFEGRRAGAVGPSGSVKSTAARRDRRARARGGDRGAQTASSLALCDHHITTRRRLLRSSRTRRAFFFRISMVPYDSAL